MLPLFDNLRNVTLAAVMVRMLLGLKEIPRPDDAADAVACAITHAHAGASREHFRIK